MDSLEGHLLGGRYRVGRRLGEGGMGAVYEAVQENLGRRVAVKVLSPALRDDATFIERFRREAEAAGRLMHPHIVQVTDFVQSPGEPVLIVMERLEGESLLDLLRRERLPMARACRIALQLLSALEAAHAAGLVHRDLKPANVFLVPLAGDDELVKLLDFGIAKLMESDGYRRLTQTGVMIGTPRYAAPEQIASRAIVDARTDLYATGVLLYGMLAGRPPFTSSGAQLLADIQERDPPDLRVAVPSLPAELAALVHRALRKRPEERFQSAAAMAGALAPFAQEASAPMGPAPAAAATVAPPRGGPAYAADIPPTDLGSPSSLPSPWAAVPLAPVHAPSPALRATALRATAPGNVPVPAATVPMSVVPSGQEPRASRPSDPRAHERRSHEPRASRPSEPRSHERSHEPRASRPSAERHGSSTGAAVRWGVALGLVGLLLIAAVTVMGVLLFSVLREPGPSAPLVAPEPTATPLDPPGPADPPGRLEPGPLGRLEPFDPEAMARVEVSAAARSLGADCVERERVGCTCPHPVAASWCAEARAENAAAMRGSERQRQAERTHCQAAVMSMRMQCLP